MKKSRFTQSQTVSILKEAAAGMKEPKSYGACESCKGRTDCFSVVVEVARSKQVRPTYWLPFTMSGFVSPGGPNRYMFLCESSR